MRALTAPLSISAEDSLEAVGCLFGHAGPAVKLFDRPDWWLGLPGGFAWHRCPACELRFLSPRPTPAGMRAYYPAHYAAYRPAINDERLGLMRWKRRRNLRGRAEAVGRRARPGRLLDVGSATGNYLAEMRGRGWQVHGVEPNGQAASYSRLRLGLDVFGGDLLAAGLPAGSFDAVTLWDVLEHTHDPLAVLREARRLLRPGGLVAFSIPDLNSLDAQRFGPAWIGYDAPRHLYLFAGRSLADLLAAAGLRPGGREHFLANYHTWLASYQTELNCRLSDGPLRRLLQRLARLPIWAPLSAPYFARLNRRGQGAVVTVYAHSPAEASHA
ncbi:MAG: class I SAM-dependent methyltransferase [Candidatus Promineifilaceae bacterium]